MNRKEWMLPREDSIGRSLTPPQTGRATERKRNAKRASMLLLACAAVALTLVISGAVLMCVGDGNDTDVLPPESQKSTGQAPPPPYNVMGFTLDVGANPLPDCTVTVTNMATGESVVTMSNEYGMYEYDLNTLSLGWTNGDMIHVLAVKDLLWGENQGAVNSALPFLQLDITLATEIPEFPMLVLPVVGTVVLLVGIRFRRKK